MGLNRPMNKTFFLKNGAVKTSGGSNNLVDGQFAVVDLKQGTNDGAAIVGAFAGAPKEEIRYALQVGTKDNGTTRSFGNKQNSSAPFALNDIKALRVSAPQRTAPQKDVVILGYDGFDADKAIKFNPKQAYWNLTIRVSGGALQYRGGDVCEEIVHIKVEMPKCDAFDDCGDCDPTDCTPINCEEIITKAVEQARRRQLTGGGTLGEFIKMTPILGECDNNPNLSLIDYNFWKVEVCDTGDDEALAAVAAQYNYPVTRIDRKGAESVYQMLVPDADSDPSDYSLPLTAVLKGCETCPEGWVTIAGGLLYAITIADGGVDRSSVITTNLANAKVVSGTVTKHGNDNGVGFYTVVYNAPITQAEITSFVGSASDNRNTATVQLIGTTASFCDPDDETEYTWVEGETCSATSEVYTIVLKDNECGQTRLAELQAAYPGLSISVDVKPGIRSRTITLTGTGGTANIAVDSVNYLATYASSLTVTAANFVTAHAAALLAEDVIVTANAGVLTFEGPTAIIAAITITNATTNLAGTLGTAATVPFRKNCSTQYTTTVVSNMVCEECSPVFKDFYTTEAPKPFGGLKWKKAPTALNPNGDCLCGIKFEGNIFVLAGDEALRDEVAFHESGVIIDVSSGYTEEIREGIGYFPQTVDHVFHESRFVPRTHLYGNSRAVEAESRSFFQGTNYQSNYVTRLFLAETAAVQDNLAQYVSYYVQVNHKEFAGGFGQGFDATAEYEIRTQVGKHVALQTLLNSMAGAAGKPAVIA
jgi:hypothetical protein